jgi:two-component system response regulator CssR
MELVNGKKGLDVIKYLKFNGVKTPLIVLSNDESILTKINALELGVDDYLWKAMPSEEMILRLNNVISRAEKNDLNGKIFFGNLVIEPNRLLVCIQHEEQSLTKIEFHLLLCLIKSYPLPLTCEFLRKEVWRQPKVEVGTINTFIWKINKRLIAWNYRLTKDQDKIFILKKE